MGLIYSLGNNICQTVIWNGINLHLYVAVIFLILLLWVWLAGKDLLSFQHRAGLAVHTFLAVFIVISLLQSVLTMPRENYFYIMADALHKGGYYSLFGERYKYIQFVMKSVPAGSSGKLLTRLHWGKDFESYLFPYWLYPHVDLLTPVEKPDCYIMFEYNKPFEFLETDKVFAYNKQWGVVCREKGTE